MSNTEIAYAYDKSTCDGKDLEHLAKILPYVGAVKVGLEALTAKTLTAGERVSIGDLVESFVLQHGKKVFEDWKFHDIPNTMGKAAYNVTSLERASGFTFHASAGPAGVAAVADALERYRAEQYADSMRLAELPVAFGVTVLTSHDEEECRSIYGSRPGPKVLQFAQSCAKAGITGLVCSALELQLLRKHDLLGEFITMVPGTRSRGAHAHDQKRIKSPAWAATHRARYVVIGREISNAPNPVEAAARIKEDLVNARV